MSDEDFEKRLNNYSDTAIIAQTIHISLINLDELFDQAIKNNGNLSDEIKEKGAEAIESLDRFLSLVETKMKHYKQDLIE